MLYSAFMQKKDKVNAKTTTKLADVIKHYYIKQVSEKLKCSSRTIKELRTTTIRDRCTTK